MTVYALKVLLMFESCCPRIKVDVKSNITSIEKFSGIYQFNSNRTTESGKLIDIHYFEVEDKIFVGRYPIYQDEERHFMHIVHMNLRTLYQFFNLVKKI